MKQIVHLEIHQKADVEIDAPEGLSHKEALQYALAALDDSGGAEWETEYGEHYVTYPPCPACGTWKCQDCGHTRSRANRFKDPEPHGCSRCGSRRGEMLPVHHTDLSTALDHADFARTASLTQAPQYPVEG